MEKIGSMRICLAVTLTQCFRRMHAAIFIITSGIDVGIQEEVADKYMNHQQFTSREWFRGPWF